MWTVRQNKRKIYVLEQFNHRERILLLCVFYWWMCTVQQPPPKQCALCLSILHHTVAALFIMDNAYTKSTRLRYSHNVLFDSAIVHSFFRRTRHTIVRNGIVQIKLESERTFTKRCVCVHALLWWWIFAWFMLPTVRNIWQQYSMTK